ncbi:VapC toxin family PIN domain ribonuclease [Lysobacteraceae bacterium NML120232]|nr:VapC toxin family PIN domain ribonuclease [Xanthomonadaceae bacterium NML120232]
MIVVDSNILAYLYLPGEYTMQAENLLRQQPNWHAPPLWRSELRNILADYVRRGQLALSNAIWIQQEAQALMLQGEQPVDSALVLTLAEQSGCTAYDCEFVALAKALGCPLYTMDKQILRAFPDLVQVLPVA